VRLVEALLRKRADLRAQNRQGKTPVDVATGDAKPLLEQKLAEAAAAAASAAAEEPSAAAEDAQAGAPAPHAEAEAGGAAAEPAAGAGSKRSLADGVADSNAKRPKVVLSFDAGEDEGEDA
jgi:hypothetical protein